jgi:thioredoxin reductase (NADPH)
MVTAIEGTDVVEKIMTVDSKKNETELSLAGVFIYIYGSKPIVDFLYGSVELTEEECVETNRMMETPLPGVFAAGDVTCTEVRQVATAAANGCVAALSAEKYVHHRTRRRSDWG